MIDGQCDCEIDKNRVLVIVGDYDVVWLDISMDNTQAVCMLKCCCHLCEPALRLIHRQNDTLFYYVPEGSPRDKCKVDLHLGVRELNIVNCRNMRMAHLRQSLLL